MVQSASADVVDVDFYLAWLTHDQRERLCLAGLRRHRRLPTTSDLGHPFTDERLKGIRCHPPGLGGICRTGKSLPQSLGECAVVPDGAFQTGLSAGAGTEHNRARSRLQQLVYEADAFHVVVIEAAHLPLT